MTQLLRKGDRVWVYSLGGFGKFGGWAVLNFNSMRLKVSGEWYPLSEIADNVVEFTGRETCEAQPS